MDERYSKILFGSPSSAGSLGFGDSRNVIKWDRRETIVEFNVL